MARPSRHDGVLYRRAGTRLWWMRYRDRTGERCQEPTGTADWKEAHKKLRERLQARDDNLLEIVRKGDQLSFKEWAELFLESYSKPPLRTPKTHEVNTRAITHLMEVFGSQKLTDLSGDAIEGYLRRRLRQRVRRKTKAGFIEKGVLKPSTVHQELRVLRRLLNLAVRKRLLPSNPCWGVEFPVAVKSLFRPHYVSWSEQQRIEAEALISNGVAEVPLTDLAVAAFRDQMEIADHSPYVFPSENNPTGHQTMFKTAWTATLRRAKVPYFRIYDLRSTYATRLSAGGVADEWVTQLLRQGDAKVFKKYSQMKLQMKREALQKLNRTANESAGVLGQAG